ncbi:MAG: AAA family ATPase [Bacteroidetes bacterium]|nr:AAA family ATPase [Bacteroidota bacterium]
MFRLRSLQLFQFRNHAQVDLDFPERITAIMGKNGSGKTGILDAIHFLSFTKSYFHHQSSSRTISGCVYCAG